MHDMLERRISHQAQVQALRARTDAPARRDAPSTSSTDTTKPKVTKTVVVTVPPSSTAPAPAKPTTTAPAPAPATPSTTPPKPTTSTTPSTSPTPSTTPSTTHPTTTPTTSATPPATTKPATTTNRNIASPAFPVTAPSTSPSVLSPTVDAPNAKAETSSGLSSGATGGIVTVVVLIVAVATFFMVRKLHIRRRERKRNTWGAGLYPSYNDKDTGLGEHQGLTANEPVPTPITSSSFGATYGPGLTPQTPAWQDDQLVSRSPMTHAAPISTPIFYITPPQASYNNAATEDAYGGLAAPAPAPPSADTAIVNKMYIPTLADELSVTVGEVVHVLRAFDDGWALCQNSRGDKGVVPLQCIDWAQGDAMGAQQMPANPTAGGYGHDSMNGVNVNVDWRNSKRLSSLSGQGPRF